MAQDKPFKTIDELVALLVDERGLVCSDPDGLAQLFRATNYYRFSGYARQFQRDPKYGDNQFVSGSNASDVMTIMALDNRLRHLLFRQLTVIEIAVRSVLAHELGRTHGSDAFYLDESSYLRYRNVPIWAAVEVMSFGRIASMIEYFADRDSIKASAAVLAVQWDPFGSVVHSLSVLRNLCCHHSQLWHRRLDIQCPVQKKLRPRGIKYDPAGPYAAIIMANHYRKKIDGDTETADEIAALLESNKEFAEGIYSPQPK